MAKIKQLMEGRGPGIDADGDSDRLDEHNDRFEGCEPIGAKVRTTLDLHRTFSVICRPSQLILCHAESQVQPGGLYVEVL
jgi:hypothetical protein